MFATYLFRQTAADQLGIHFAKLERLRLRGLIPEVVRVGRYFLYPAERLDAIRERLVRQGHLPGRAADA
jgi:hypothetical protein